MVCISKSNDIAIGLRLAGVESFYIRNDEQIIAKVKEIAKNKDVGILNVTEDVYEVAKKELTEISETQKLPLVVTIPNSAFKYC